MDMHNSNYVLCQYHTNSVFDALASMYPKCARNIWAHFYKNNTFSNIRITHGLFLSCITQEAYCLNRNEEACIIQGERWAGKPEEANDTITPRAGPGCNNFWFSPKQWDHYDDIPWELTPIWNYFDLMWMKICRAIQAIIALITYIILSVSWTWWRVEL